MNIKKILFYSTVIGAFLMLVDWFIHGILLSSFYESTSFIWRSKIEMSDMFLQSLLLYFVQGYLYYVFYTMFNVDKFALGMGVGFICAIQDFSFIMYIPLTLTVAIVWAATKFVQALGAAIICGMLS